jgi:hypothetical protein
MKTNASLLVPSMVLASMPDRSIWSPWNAEKSEIVSWLSEVESEIAV